MSATMTRHFPRYPIYIPTKGRASQPMTIRMFEKANIPFFVAVEPSQVELYAEWKDRLVVFPEDGKGLVYARNQIKEHSIANGDKRHWQFDDDIRYMSRVVNGHRLRGDPAPMLAAMEDFVDRYENVALCSPNSEFFIPMSKGKSYQPWPVFYRNARCYTVFLHLNEAPFRWRGRYNEDTDMSLQVLAGGWCTILFNAFLISTAWTEQNATNVKNGGGQAGVYAGDGRLKMARDLERVWPGVVTTKRRFGRPQHSINGKWKKFDTPLIRRKDIDWSALEEKKVDEYGMRLRATEEAKAIVERIQQRRQQRDCNP